MADNGNICFSDILSLFPSKSKSKGPSDHNIDIWFIDQVFKSFFPNFPSYFFGAWRCVVSRKRRQSLLGQRDRELLLLLPVSVFSVDAAEFS
jgi:hypothetical protein